MQTHFLALAAALSLAAGPARAVDGFAPAVSKKLEAILAQGPGLAVFDADNTLWVDDIGEGFFTWLVQTRRLKAVDYSSDPIAEYFRVEETDKPRAYGMAVTQMAGLRESDVRRWAATYFRVAFAKRVYAAQRNLIAALHGAGWEVWIVSASNRWIVQAAAPSVGVDPSHVIGIDLVVEDGILTDRLAYPVTWGQGKVAAIEQLIGRLPDLVAGDSRGDLEMLQSARRGALLVLYPSKSSQSELRTVARRRGWMTQKMR